MQRRTKGVNYVLPRQGRDRSDMPMRPECRLEHSGATRLREAYWASEPKPRLADFARSVGAYTRDGRPMSKQAVHLILRRETYNSLPLVPGEPGYRAPAVETWEELLARFEEPVDPYTDEYYAAPAARGALAGLAQLA